MNHILLLPIMLKTERCSCAYWCFKYFIIVEILQNEADSITHVLNIFKVYVRLLSKKEKKPIFN